MDTSEIGRLLLIGGVVMCVAGLALMLGPRVPFLGRLPGDIVAGNEHVTFYFPVVSMILGSVVLTILLNVLPRLFK